MVTSLMKRMPVEDLQLQITLMKNLSDDVTLDKYLYSDNIYKTLQSMTDDEAVKLSSIITTDYNKYIGGLLNIRTSLLYLLTAIYVKNNNNLFTRKLLKTKLEIIIRKLDDVSYTLDLTKMKDFDTRYYELMNEAKQLSSVKSIKPLMTIIDDISECVIEVSEFINNKLLYGVNVFICEGLTQYYLQYKELNKVDKDLQLSLFPRIWNVTKLKLKIVK